MVESKVFATEPADASPPLVQAQAAEPLDLWHLQAVPVVEPSAPSHFYDEHEGQQHSAASVVEPLPTLIIDEHSPLDEPSDMDFEPENPEGQLKVGAGVASGVIGLLLGGPLLGLFLGFGAAYAAQRDDEWGDSARAVGHVALAAQEQARAVNQKHNLVQRSQRAAQKAWHQAQELDRKHHILDQTAAFLRASWEATRAFVQKHRLVERGMEGAAKTFAWAMEQMQKKILQESQHGRTVEQDALRSNRR